MLFRNWRYGVMVAVAVLSLAASNGCCCRTRKGFVLRGDWSLEFNRVPHMQSNGPTYSGDCCAPACGVPCGCADDCYQGGVGSAGYEVIDGSGYPGGGGAGGGNGAGGRGGYAPGGSGNGGYGNGADGGTPMPAPPMPTPAAQSRFHPVPTRPAFEPQGLAWEGHSAEPAVSAPSQPPAHSGRRTSSRYAVRPSRTTVEGAPIRRTAYIEVEVEDDAFYEYQDADRGDSGGGGEHLSDAGTHALPAAGAQAPAPTTSTWRVKSRQS